MSDAKTLAVYAEKADAYHARFSRAEPDQDLQAFMDALSTGARVLDLGCGTGQAAAMMAAHGLQVDAWDASPEMVEKARASFGLAARVATFDELAATQAYDGLWANFSLLHAPRSALPGHLARIHTALRPGGLLHLGMKTGTGEGRDALGRFYAYFSVEELIDHVTAAGFSGIATRTGAEAGLAGSVDPFVILRAHA